MNRMVFLLAAIFVTGGVIINLCVQSVFALQSPRVAPTFGGLDQTCCATNSSAYGSHLQILDLANLPSERFVTVGHQSFPSYQLRVKRVNDFCDTTVR